jgi:hypothetical protein
VKFGGRCCGKRLGGVGGGGGGLPPHIWLTKIEYINTVTTSHSHKLLCMHLFVLLCIYCLYCFSVHLSTSCSFSTALYFFFIFVRLLYFLYYLTFVY